MSAHKFFECFQIEKGKPIADGKGGDYVGIVAVKKDGSVESKSVTGLKDSYPDVSSFLADCRSKNILAKGSAGHGYEAPKAPKAPKANEDTNDEE